MIQELDNHQEMEESQEQAHEERAIRMPKVQPEITDEELMRRIQARDERALELLIQRFTPFLRNVVGRIIANDQDVTDVVEEVFLGVWNQAENFTADKGKAIGWIVTMARRRAIDRTRRRQAYDRAEMRFRLANDTGYSHFAGESVERDAEQADTAQLISEIMATLPEAQQEVVKLAFYSGLSQREIAAKTGIPLGTIKTRLELGVKKLRAAITAMGTKEEWLNAA